MVSKYTINCEYTIKYQMFAEQHITDQKDRILPRLWEKNHDESAKISRPLVPFGTQPTSTTSTLSLTCLTSSPNISAQ